MLDALCNLFRVKNSARAALSKMGRIVSRHSMTRVMYDRGLQEERRRGTTLYSSVGVWLFPGPSESLSVESGIPAVTKDLRTGGIGIMSLIPVMTESLVIAVPDEDRWTFLECEVRHKNAEFGGWFQMGFEVIKDVKLTVEATVEFERRCSAIMRAAQPQSA